MKRTVSIDEIIEREMKDDEFRASFLEESEKLESAIALTRAREEAGYSQRELAKLSNVPQKTISRIESGENTSVGTLTKLALAMGKRMEITFS